MKQAASAQKKLIAGLKKPLNNPRLPSSTEAQFQRSRAREPILQRDSTQDYFVRLVDPDEDRWEARLIVPAERVAAPAPSAGDAWIVVAASSLTEARRVADSFAREGLEDEPWTVRYKTAIENWAALSPNRNRLAGVKKVFVQEAPVLRAPGHVLADDYDV